MSASTSAPAVDIVSPSLQAVPACRHDPGLSAESHVLLGEARVLATAGSATLAAPSMDSTARLCRPSSGLSWSAARPCCRRHARRPQSAAVRCETGSIRLGQGCGPTRPAVSFWEAAGLLHAAPRVSFTWLTVSKSSNIAALACCRHRTAAQSGRPCLSWEEEPRAQDRVPWGRHVKVLSSHRSCRANGADAMP